MVANSLTISSDFNLGSPLEEVQIYEFYIIITETQDEWMPMSLLDHSEQCVEFFQILKNEGLLTQTISPAVGSWYITRVSNSNFNLRVYILTLYDCICYI